VLPSIKFDYAPSFPCRRRMKSVEVKPWPPSPPPPPAVAIPTSSSKKPILRDEGRLSDLVMSSPYNPDGETRNLVVVDLDLLKVG